MDNNSNDQDDHESQIVMNKLFGILHHIANHLF